jgi:hypothetical protein
MKINGLKRNSQNHIHHVRSGNYSQTRQESSASASISTSQNEACDNDDPYSLSKLKKDKKRSNHSQPAIQEFEGKVVGVELFLVDKHSQIAYKSERDDDGNLVSVGKWNAQTKTIDSLPESEDDSSSRQSSPLSSATSSSSKSKSHQRSSSSSPAPSLLSDDEKTTTRADFPYPVDDADHCETGADAYRDIEPILNQVRLCFLLHPRQASCHPRLT